jgi:hypothetical protein
MPAMSAAGERSKSGMGDLIDRGTPRTRIGLAQALRRPPGAVWARIGAIREVCGAGVACRIADER